MAERVIIFIDGSNLYNALHALSPAPEGKLDFSRFVESLSKSRELVEARYYNAPLDRRHDPASYRRQQQFFAALSRIPRFRVILCRMQRILDPDGKPRYRVKDDDIHIAVDMVSLAYEDRYDTAILVSGDGDFLPAVDCIRRRGKAVENAYFSQRSSGALQHGCDRSLLLDPLVRALARKE